MLKEYVYKGYQFQFDEDKVPAGAVPLAEYFANGNADQQPAADQQPEQKAAEPKNKQRAGRSK